MQQGRLPSRQGQDVDSAVSIESDLRAVEPIGISFAGAPGRVHVVAQIGHGPAAVTQRSNPALCADERAILRIEVDLAVDGEIGHVAELFILVPVRLQRQRQGQRLACRSFAAADFQRRIRRQLRRLGRRAAEVANPRFPVRSNGTAHGHLGGPLAAQRDLACRQFNRPRLTGELDRQLNCLLPAAVVVNAEHRFGPFAGRGIDDSGIGRQQPTVIQQREERFGLRRPAAQIGPGVIAVPTCHAVDLNRSLPGWQVQPPRRAVASHAGRHAARSRAVASNRNFAEERAVRIEQVELCGRRRKTGDLDIQRAFSRQKAHVRRLFGTPQYDRFLMPFVLVAARRFDQVSRAVRREAPRDLFAVAVLRHGDIQHIEALPWDTCGKPCLLDRSPAAAARLAIVRNRRLLDHAPLRSDENGPQFRRAPAPIPVPFQDLNRQLARFGQQVHSSEPPQACFPGTVPGGYRIRCPCLHRFQGSQQR